VSDGAGDAEPDTEAAGPDADAVGDAASPAATCAWHALSVAATHSKAVASNAAVLVRCSSTMFAPPRAPNVLHVGHA
jgi:hypothetical protein